MITEFTLTVNPDIFGLVERSARQSFEAELAIKRPFLKSISARGKQQNNITAASLPDFSNYRAGRGSLSHNLHAIRPSKKLMVLNGLCLNSLLLR